MKKLISMTDYVLQQNKAEEVTRQSYIKCRDYAQFLSQTLNVSMFTPAKLVDGEWVVLEKPKDYVDVILQGSRVYNYEDILAYKEYETALSNVLFAGFEVGIFKGSKDNHFEYIDNKKHQFKIFVKDVGLDYWKKTDNAINTIEDLVKYNLTLTYKNI